MPTRVLVADPSRFMRDLVAELLAEDYEVVGRAETGVEAVDLWAEHDPEVVVIDARMPIRDGIDAATEIKSRDPETGVVVCTAREDQETMREAFSAGADEYVTKPFQKPAFLEAVYAASPA